MRKRSVAYGALAALILILLIGLGSRGFHWFDASLIGYVVGTIFVVAAVTYKYTFWIDRPPTGRYWRRSWEMFLSFANFRRYTSLVPRAIITDLFTQDFIRKRGRYRWIMHQCIFWGVILSCLITFPLTFGWLRFTQTPVGAYQIWVVGFPFFNFPPGSVFGFLIFHALDFTALLLIIGLALALHRRFHDLAVISIQRFNFDLMPLALLLAIALTGLALTADSAWLGGAYYDFIALTHEAVVVLWLISLPFGKFFHLIERPATVGIKLYTRITRAEAMHACARCGTEFATERFVGDLKKTLADVGENYTLPAAATFADGETATQSAPLWWQDLCPRCKRVMRAQAIFMATGREGNRFL
ncbi:MAG: MFS transporter [Ktedonobacterales bacterium]